MKLIIDRSEIQKAVKQAQEDGNIPENFNVSSVRIDDVKKTIMENAFGDEQEQEEAVRQAVIDLYA